MCVCAQTDADPEVCKRMCRANDSEPVLSLVSYYQMVRKQIFSHNHTHTHTQCVHVLNSVCVCVHHYTGTSCLVAAAAVEGVWCDVWSGCLTHLHTA